MYKLACLFVLFSMISCQSITSSGDHRLGEEFELGFGEQVSLDNRGLSIEFKDLLEDSRCPEGVTCVWAGNAQVALLLNDSQATLNTYLEPQEMTISGYRIELISVSPYPVYEQDIAKEDYVAKLVVAKN